MSRRERDFELVDLCCKRMREHSISHWYKFIMPWRQRRFDYYAAVSNRIINEWVAIDKEESDK